MLCHSCYELCIHHGIIHDQLNRSSYLDPVYTDIHEALIAQCRRGDAKAQHELYKLYARSMYNVCMRMVNHVGEAEDILQESFLEAFTKLGDFRAEASFGSWLKRIVINRSINYLRKRKLELVESIAEADLVEELTDEDEELQLEVSRVHKAIQELPDGYRIVLTMYLLEGYDHSEIAEALHISESTSKSQLNRAKNKLREKLSVYAQQD